MFPSLRASLPPSLDRCVEYLLRYLGQNIPWGCFPVRDTWVSAKSLWEHRDSGTDPCSALTLSRHTGPTLPSLGRGTGERFMFSTCLGTAIALASGSLCGHLLGVGYHLLGLVKGRRGREWTVWVVWCWLGLPVLRSTYYPGSLVLAVSSWSSLAFHSVCQSNWVNARHS